MVEKLFMMSPRVNTGDYPGGSKQAAVSAEAGSFAKALENEREPQRQNSADMSPKTPAEGRRMASMAHGIALSSGGITLDQRSLSTLQRLNKGGEGGMGADVKKAAREVKPQVSATGDGETGLGRLSAKYESGSAGSEAIGYDGNGGTSYGKYQISSRQGTFKQFLSFLSENAPDIGERLRKAGTPNTGGTRGAVPTAWKAIAAEQPERFEALQEAFIHNSHYAPAEAGVKEALGTGTLSPAMQEVVWSTAVQHGPVGARRLFSQAVKNLKAEGKTPANEQAMIETVYKLRKGQFSSSSPSVQAAVRRRFDDESRQAVAMLKGQTAVG